MSIPVEKFEFQTEARQLLDLMIHSVYSHREIFLRELISNASDALDKLRFEALTNTELAHLTGDLHIRITPDAEDRTLTISDNGVGMNRDEIIRFIGTIAKSGTKEYVSALKEAKQANMPVDLIGQFGVGFYSSFMVADKVTLITRRAGDAIAWKWESIGDGSFTIEESTRDIPGTSVMLHLKPADQEDEVGDYTAEWTIRQIVKKYSDFVSYPIRMEIERTETERDEDGKPKEGVEPQKVLRDETLNSMKAIWTRPESEVTEEEYNEFYHHVSHDWSEPLKWTTLKAEGTHEFRALLYFPARAPFDLFMRDGQHGIHLYIKRIFIMNDCKELIPEYLRFMRGVVDSEDLSLNISREILQKNRQIQVIRKGVTRKVLETLKSIKKDEKEKYQGFWKEFGRVLKEGLFQDLANRDPLFELCLFNSTAGDELVSLEDYVGRMKPGQNAIYYMTGDSLPVLRTSPHLEAFRDKGYDVLLMDEPVDEVWTQSVTEYHDKKLVSVGKGSIELGTDEEKKQAEESRQEQEKNYRPLLDTMKEKLSAQIKDVRLSNRLTSSPVCLVSDDGDMSPQMEQLLRASGQEIPALRRILELNPSHRILEKLHDLHEQNKDDQRLTDYAELLYGQALLAEGGKLPDPAAFSKKLAELMERAM